MVLDTNMGHLAPSPETRAVLKSDFNGGPNGKQRWSLGLFSAVTPPYGVYILSALFLNC